MTTGTVMQCDLGPAGADVSVTVTYDTATLILAAITYGNASGADAVGEADGPGGFTRTYRLAAGSAGATIDLSKQGMQLANRTIQKTTGPVTIADWPDGWSFSVRWPA